MSHSWLGKVNIIKMNVLPRILFVFQMIPLGVPIGFFTLLQTMISRFIWRDSHPSLSRAVLYHSKSSGGLALPNLKAYYHAVVLSRVADWKYAKASKLWVQLEHIISGMDLSAAPWIPRFSRNLAQKTSSFTTSSLDVWDALHKKFSSAYHSPRWYSSTTTTLYPAQWIWDFFFFIIFFYWKNSIQG